MERRTVRPCSGTNFKVEREKKMQKLTTMTTEQFVEKMTEERLKREKAMNRAKGSGSKPSIKRYNRRHR
jgi:hypothetical protein